MKLASAGVSGSHAALAFTFFSSTSTMGSMSVAYLHTQEKLEYIIQAYAPKQFQQTTPNCYTNKATLQSEP
jgi:hypothetical protein